VGEVVRMAQHTTPFSLSMAARQRKGSFGVLSFI
jgi:hypothetical protein